MEVVRKIVDAEKLVSVMTLPKTFRNRRLEVLVLPIEETVETEQRQEEINKIVDSLVGIIPDSGMDMNDYRAERLKKYESID